MESVVELEGGYSSYPEERSFYKNFLRTFYEALENYWASRALIMVGIVLVWVFPWYLITLTLVLDLIFQNPAPIRPRNTAISLFHFAQLYWRQYTNRKIKKPE